MRDLYSVLHIAPTAGDDEIKTAFRSLAKSFHPDLKPGDAQAEESFKEVNRAYKFLSDPEARKFYDTYLCHKRAWAQKRWWRFVSTTCTSLVLTSACMLLVLVSLEGGPRFVEPWEHGSEDAQNVELGRAPLPGLKRDAQSGAGRHDSMLPGQELAPDTSAEPGAEAHADSAVMAERFAGSGGRVQ